MGEEFKVPYYSGEHKLVLDELKTLGGTDLGMTPIEDLSGFEEAKLVNVFTFDDASKLFYKY